MSIKIKIKHVLAPVLLDLKDNSIENIVQKAVSTLLEEDFLDETYENLVHEVLLTNHMFVIKF